MQLIAAVDEYRGKWNVVEKRENRYLTYEKIFYLLLF
jgi:hypothetical protein